MLDALELDAVVHHPLVIVIHGHGKVVDETVVAQVRRSLVFILGELFGVIAVVLPDGLEKVRVQSDDSLGAARRTAEVGGSLDHEDGKTSIGGLDGTAHACRARPAHEHVHVIGGIREGPRGVRDVVGVLGCPFLRRFVVGKRLRAGHAQASRSDGRGRSADKGTSVHRDAHM